MRALILAALVCAGCSSSSPMAATPVGEIKMQPVPVLPVRGAPFDQLFWNQFVYDSLESPTLQPLRRLVTAPRLYLKTVDEAGQPIDAVTLQTVQDAMTFVAPTWGGGQVGMAGVQRGTGTMEGQPGWLTVKWPNPNAGAFCGLAQVGTDGGWIQLNYLNTNCACGGASKMYPSAARHELGHAFGYWHTDNVNDVMHAGVTPRTLCDAQPSAREVYHATIAYQSPVGSTGFAPMSAAPPIVIVD